MSPKNKKILIIGGSILVLGTIGFVVYNYMKNRDSSKLNADYIASYRPK